MAHSSKLLNQPALELCGIYRCVCAGSLLFFTAQHCPCLWRTSRRLPLAGDGKCQLNELISIRQKRFCAALYLQQHSRSFVPALALIITALFDPNAIALVVVYFVSNVLTDLYLYWYIMRVYKPEQTKRDPAMLSYAKHLSFMGIISGLAGSLDQILLFHFVGPVELAIYAFATGIPDQIKGPIKNLDGMLQARFAAHSSQDIKANMRTKFLLMAVFAIAAVGVYILLAPFLYGLLYPNYLEAIRYSQIYMLSYIGLIFAPASSYLWAKKFVTEQYISTVSISLLQIALMLLGVVEWGLWGLSGLLW